MWSLDTCMDVNRQNDTPWLLLDVIIRHAYGRKQTDWNAWLLLRVIIRRVYGCKQTTKRPVVFYMWSLDTCIDVNRQNKTSCRILHVIIIRVCGRKQAEWNAWFLLRVIIRRVYGCKQTTKRPVVFYVWSLDTCIDVNRQNKTSCRILHVIIRHVYLCKQIEQNSLTYLMCNQ